MPGRQGKNIGLGKQERMKLVHETVVERGEIFETLRASFFETFEEEDLCARVYLFQKSAQLSHGVTGWSTEYVVHEAFDELLSEIFAVEVALGELSRSQKLIEWYGLRSKWNRWLLLSGHAGDTPACDRGKSVYWSNSTGPLETRQVYRRGM